MAPPFNNPNAPHSEGGALAVVVKSFPERRITPVAVASGAIEVSVMGEGEGSGGGDGGARGDLSPVGGSKGPEPLASPNVIHWVGWLPGTSRCGAGLAAPPRTPRRRAARSPSHGECRLRLSTCPATGIAPKIRSLLFRGTRPHGGSRSRTVRSPRNLLLSCKAVEATAMVSSRDRLSQGPGSGQVTAYQILMDDIGCHWTVWAGHGNTAGLKTVSMGIENGRVLGTESVRAGHSGFPTGGEASAR